MSEGAILNTLNFFFPAKRKMHADLLVLYSKNYLIVTTSVHCLGKNIELLKNLFFMDIIIIILLQMQLVFKLFKTLFIDQTLRKGVFY